MSSYTIGSNNRSSSNSIGTNSEIDKLSTIVQSSQTNDDGISKIDDTEDTCNLTQAEYLKQYSFDPGLTSSESDTAYERIEEAKQWMKRKKEKRKQRHEAFFNNLEIPDWIGMNVKKWNPYKIRIHFYLRHLAESNLVGDYKYKVYLKTNHKLWWYIYYTSVPHQADVRRFFIDEMCVTVNNLIEAIRDIFLRVQRFAKYCALNSVQDDRESESSEL